MRVTDASSHYSCHAGAYLEGFSVFVVDSPDCTPTPKEVVYILHQKVKPNNHGDTTVQVSIFSTHNHANSMGDPTEARMYR